MSNLVFWRGARGRGLALAAMMSGSALVTGCSTDVQRFGYTGSLRPTAAIQAAPVERVQSASLNRPVSVPASAPALGSASAPESAYGGARETYRPAPIPASAGFVTVRPGDTAYSIARNNGVTVAELATVNRLQYPYEIKIGQRLSIPNGGPNGGSAAANYSTPPMSPAPVRVAARGGSTYSVVPGDTLFNISQRYGVGVGALASANNLDDYGSVKIGQRLVIPAGASTAQGGPLQPAATSQAGQRILSPRTVEQEKPAGEQKVATANPRERIEPLPAPPERASAQFRWPVRGRIVSRFGMATDGTRNDGINIAVPVGASVKASDNGVVAYVGDELKGYGNLILLRHANDWVTAYAHNSVLLVKRGETVKRGQIIAKAGQTGTVDMPQVHFEVRRGAKAVDPMDYLDGA